jgi:octaprenyl-diphosphate synthase
VPETLQAIYEPIVAELSQVEDRLREEFSTARESIVPLVEHSYRLGGKRLRPALVLLSASAMGNLNDQHLTLATTVELIHTATLIHDDVLDEAEIRRHEDTVNARWGNEASILLGDYLLARALCLAGSVETIDACRIISEASRQVCEGELCQVVNRGNYRLAEDEYYSIISGKTAALCACCTRLGAHYAGAERATIEQMALYGHHLGVAFQMVDDLLDLSGKEENTGKSLGTDLVKQKLTLPLIRMLDQLPTGDREELLDELNDEKARDKTFLAPWFAKTDAIEYTRQKAIDQVELATKSLDGLPSNAAIESLKQLAAFVIRRHH